MKERIREFAIQSGLPTALDYHQKRYEKFAIMIVRECAGIIESQDVDPSFKIRMGMAVKKHFGIQE